MIITYMYGILSKRLPKFVISRSRVHLQILRHRAHPFPLGYCVAQIDVSIVPAIVSAWPRTQKLVLRNGSTSLAFRDGPSGAALPQVGVVGVVFPWTWVQIGVFAFMLLANAILGVLFA